MDHSCPEKEKLDEALMVVGEEIRSLETAQLRASLDKHPHEYPAISARLRGANQRQDAVLEDYRQHLRQHRC